MNPELVSHAHVVATAGVYAALAFAGGVVAGHRLRRGRRAALWDALSLAARSGSEPAPASGPGPVRRADSAPMAPTPTRTTASDPQGSHGGAGGLDAHRRPDGGTGTGHKAPEGWPAGYHDCPSKG